MKKITLVLSVVFMAALLAFSAAAVAQEYEAGEDNSFDITYTGTPGQYYAIVIVEGIVEEGTAPSITEDSIQYIDQKTAGANGTVSFENVLLFEDGTEATVFLGGSDLPGAVVLGWVNKTEEATTFTVSGAITSRAKNASAVVTLTSKTDSSKVFTVNSADDAYAIAVPADIYEVVVKLNGHTSYTNRAVEVLSSDVVVNATLIGGDTDGSESINDTDLANVIGDFGKITGYKPGCDVNIDGAVNDSDLAIVLSSFGSIAVVE